MVPFSQKLFDSVLCFTASLISIFKSFYLQCDMWSIGITAMEMAEAQPRKFHLVLSSLYLFLFIKCLYAAIFPRHIMLQACI